MNLTHGHVCVGPIRIPESIGMIFKPSIGMIFEPLGMIFEPLGMIFEPLSIYCETLMTIVVTVFLQFSNKQNLELVR